MTLAEQQANVVDVLRSLDRPATTRELADHVGIETAEDRVRFRARLVMWSKRGVVSKVEADGGFYTAWVLP